MVPNCYRIGANQLTTKMNRVLKLFLLISCLCGSQITTAQIIDNAQLTLRKGVLITERGVKIKRHNAHLYLSDPLFKEYKTASTLNTVATAFVGTSVVTLLVGGGIAYFSTVGFFTQTAINEQRAQLGLALTYTGCAFMAVGASVLLCSQLKLYTIKTRHNAIVNSLSNIETELRFGLTSSGIGLTLRF